MKFLLSFAFVWFTLMLCHAQSGKKYQISPALEQIPLWPHSMPDNLGSREPEKSVIKDLSPMFQIPDLLFINRKIPMVLLF
ncbi:hypothetical protein [Chryseobacterium oranimense]|uniref:hypothetical protein n=1 Tax=Chryseobacterium oranimense TaxID=421058 RepID=UPI0011148CDF|nr:hypothetical protein [Chryseobacterium oranimense]